jgi:hypothetical protein
MKTEMKTEFSKENKLDRESVGDEYDGGGAIIAGNNLIT